MPMLIDLVLNWFAGSITEKDVNKLKSGAYLLAYPLSKPTRKFPYKSLPIVLMFALFLFNNIDEFRLTLKVCEHVCTMIISIMHDLILSLFSIFEIIINLIWKLI